VTSIQPRTRPGETARAVRVPDDLWKAAKTKAAERGETVSDVIRQALKNYVAR
jgi:predicted DNA binding CopG/RHH family protein